MNPDWKSALARLVEGNRRFVSGLRSMQSALGHVRVKELAQVGQKPFAVILSCSDSRVPAELLFDCGFGDLFVIRVAGNVVQPSQIASIEYGAQVLGATLCVVMGHTKCGAVQAAFDAERGQGPDLGPNVDFLIELIRPAIQRTLAAHPASEPGVLELCVRENVRATTVEVMARSSLLRNLAAHGGFRVVEAICHLESGEVDFRST